MLQDFFDSPPFRFHLLLWLSMNPPEYNLVLSSIYISVEKLTLFVFPFLWTSLYNLFEMSKHFPINLGLMMRFKWMIPIFHCYPVQFDLNLESWNQRSRREGYEVTSWIEMFVSLVRRFLGEIVVFTYRRAGCFFSPII